MRRLLATSAALLAAAACGETPSQPSAAVDGLPTASAMAELIPMCHLDADAGVYAPISIHPNAETPHRSHGDGQVGDPVPGMEGYEFNESCQPQRVAVPISACFAKVEAYWNSRHASTYGPWDWDGFGEGSVPLDLGYAFRITSGLRWAEVVRRTDGFTACYLSYNATSAELVFFDDFDASKAYLQSLIP